MFQFFDVKPSIAWMVHKSIWRETLLSEMEESLTRARKQLSACTFWVISN